MFTRARYVVIDDEESELMQLVNCLRKIGAPCLPILYDVAVGIDPKHLSGVRLLFLDLHLTTGGQTTDIAQASGVIAGILEDGIVPTAGPYVIILWTTHQLHREGFETYIMEHVAPPKRPLAILSLDKNQYLAGNAGEKLMADVAKVIETDPRLRALLEWEREVLKAAGTTLAEVGALVSAADRKATRFSERLDEVLSLLASEAVGTKNATEDPYSAVNAVLMPILSDRIANQRIEPSSNAIWRAAVTKIGKGPAPSTAEAARLNSMLHIAAVTTEELRTGTWGAITLLPESELNDESIIARFNLSATSLLEKTFCIADEAKRALSRLCLLRIGASCDYAQRRKGPVPFMLGAIMPTDVKRPEKTLPKAEIVTPPLIVDGFDIPVQIAFNAHMTVTMVESQFHEWPPLCRLRESLLMQITTHGAQHATRPGIISFYGKSR